MSRAVRQSALVQSLNQTGSSLSLYHSFYVLKSTLERPNRNRTLNEHQDRTVRQLTGSDFRHVVVLSQSTEILVEFFHALFMCLDTITLNAFE